MRIFSLVVAKNEANRYLSSCLSHLSRFSQIFLYDDRSTDGTAEIAEKHGARVHVRCEKIPSFLEHEGKFRNDSWKIFQEAMCPTEEDWVLINDADEFLVGGNVFQILRDSRIDILTLKIPEVFRAEFDVETNRYTSPLVRVDGYWNKNSHPRLFRYRKCLTFADKRMGCGSYPEQITKTVPSNKLSLLHVGYMNHKDRHEKHSRYSSLPGHSKKHIQSITESPKLEPWNGEWPDVWRPHP